MSGHDVTGTDGLGVNVNLASGIITEGKIPATSTAISAISSGPISTANMNTWKTTFPLGVLGNSLVLYVYNRRLRKGTIRWFIQALAVFDLLSCLVAIPGEIVDMRINYTFGHSPMCQVLRTVSMFCTVASGMTLVVVAVERYKRICTPLGRQITPREAQIIVGVCTGVAAMCAAPASVLYGEQTTPTDDPRINGSDCSTADTFINTVFPLAFSSFQCLLFVGGALVLVVLYSLIGRKIWSHAHFRKVGFAAAANRRMSFIFTGSECSSPTTDDVIFTFPYRKSGGGEASSDSNNGITDIGTACNNNNIDSKLEALDENKEIIPTPTAEPGEKDHEMFSSALNGQVTPENDPGKAGDGTEPAGEVMLRKTYSRQTSADNPAPKTESRSRSGDSLLRKKSVSKGRERHRSGDSKGRERHRSGDSTLRGRYQRRASIRTQSDIRRFLNRSDSVNSVSRRTTLMLFLITVVYVVSFLPYLILMVVKVLDEDSLSGRGDGWELAHNILIRSYFINSMANPIIYSFCSRTFRKETNMFLHCRYCKK
nr:hypothetical protein BaRGS_011447 [Batillaria attramentaria]